MCLWSFLACVFSNAGSVPAYWGFSSDETPVTKRRYCLSCNVFKPERCHHCSACNRCVLNMDHHCLWINNCVGFWNRKHFILLLAYALMLTSFVIITMGYDFYKACAWTYDQKIFDLGEKDFEKNILIIVLYLLNTLVGLIMSFFLRFHYDLGTENKTTIENLAHDGMDYISKYDIGSQNNWNQIFGSNKFLYPFPTYWPCGQPHGDGIHFKINPDQVSDNQSQSIFSSIRKLSKNSLL